MKLSSKHPRAVLVFSYTNVQRYCEFFLESYHVYIRASIFSFLYTKDAARCFFIFPFTNFTLHATIYVTLSSFSDTPPFCGICILTGTLALRCMSQRYVRPHFMRPKYRRMQISLQIYKIPQGGAGILRLE